MRSLSRACLSVRQAESREGLQPAQKAFRKRGVFFVFSPYKFKLYNLSLLVLYPNIFLKITPINK